MNSNRVQILGKIRLDWFVISLNLEIGFLRVKSMFLKGQVSPSLYKDEIVFLLREGEKARIIRRDPHLTPGLEIGRSRRRRARSQVSGSASICPSQFPQFT